MSLRLWCFPSDLSPPIQCVSHLLGLPPSFTVQSLAAVVCLALGLLDFAYFLMFPVMCSIFMVISTFFVGDLSPEITDATLFDSFSAYNTCSDGGTRKPDAQEALGLSIQVPFSEDGDESVFLKKVEGSFSDPFTILIRLWWIHRRKTDSCNELPDYVS
ncbi:unnamed protein product [Microthlaspi erraticum]|uniref:Uncharacterized protein n=1 Tax=Microthlaspi erraticum TaxID=1685480 RepID=A0A6D2I4M1_9BRAS|nr:unnamed protein product [Microthlaspi erraticum]